MPTTKQLKNARKKLKRVPKPKGNSPKIVDLLTYILIRDDPAKKRDRNFIESQKEYEKIFRLKGTKNKNFPYKFQVKLPCWCLKDVSFLSWVIGFGHHVKVKEPKQLKDTVYQTGLSIVEVYDQ